MTWLTCVLLFALIKYLMHFEKQKYAELFYFIELMRIRFPAHDPILHMTKR